MDLRKQGITLIASVALAGLISPSLGNVYAASS